MLKFRLALALFVLPLLLTAQQGMQFNTSSWADVLSLAKEQNKAIFVDAYTTWCGPCKKMSKETFTQQPVGDFYNANFINVKLDMEAEGDGMALAADYEVNVFPTLLYFDANGDLVHRAIGYKEADEFIEVGKTALDPEKQVIALKKKFDKGDRSPEFLYRYAFATSQLMDFDASIVETYLATQDDWSTAENMKFIYELSRDLNSRSFAYMMENAERFNGMFGADAMKNKMNNSLYDYLMNTTMNGEEPDFAKLDGMMSKVMAEEEKAGTLSNLQMNYYMMLGDWENFATTAVKYMDKYPMEDAEMLNSIAWTFYENIEDKDQLNEAIKWALKAVKLSNVYHINDTVASLYYKVGNKKKAKEYAKRAISIGKKNGEDVSATEELLKTINGK